MASLSPLLKQATPVVVDHALGSWITGTDGKRYLDFTTGIGVTSTGHCHPKVVEAAREQAGKIIHAQYTTVMHQPLLKLTEKLSDFLPQGIDSVFYATSGSEAVEASIRLARIEWILDDDKFYLFSFDNICEGLALDPNYVRRGLIRWKEMVLRELDRKQARQQLAS